MSFPSFCQIINPYLFDYPMETDILRRLDIGNDLDVLSTYNLSPEKTCLLEVNPTPYWVLLSGLAERTSPIEP